MPALRGTDYLVSCVPLYATESQMPLIFAAREAGVERFVPSEYGAIYEFEQFWQTDTTHRLMARQKAFIRRMIESPGRHGLHHHPGGRLDRVLHAGASHGHG